MILIKLFNLMFIILLLIKIKQKYTIILNHYHFSLREIPVDELDNVLAL